MYHVGQYCYQIGEAIRKLYFKQLFLNFSTSCGVWCETKMKKVVGWVAPVFIFYSFSMGLATKERRWTVVLSKGQLYKTKARTFWDLLKKTTKKVIVKQGGWRVTYLKFVRHGLIPSSLAQWYISRTSYSSIRNWYIRQTKKKKLLVWITII